MRNVITKKKNKGVLAKILALGTTVGTVATNASVAFAGNTGGWGDSVSINNGDIGGADATNMMGNILGILLTITRFVGVALCIYGVYEIVMSFMQQQPEGKTKGIIMALSGVAMIGLKSILNGAGVIN
jgi:hypothetical protein